MKISDNFFSKNNIFIIGTNAFLRGLSMLSKFLLIVFVGKFLSINELGIYGIFFSGVITLSFLLGLDFYMFNTRELLKKDQDSIGYLIRDQIIFHFVCYMIILPIVAVSFKWGWLESSYLFTFIAILVFEHLTQELFRIFTTLFHPVVANFIFFIKNGLWILILLTIHFLNIYRIENISVVFQSWLSGEIVAFLISLGFLKYYNLSKISGKQINWSWIRKGIVIAIPFFLATISYKLMEFSDRFFIDNFLSKTEVGVYTFFYSVSNLMNAFVFTTVIMIYYPKLYKYFNEKKIAEFAAAKKQFFMATITVVTALSLVLILFVNPLANFLGKNEILESIYVFYLLIFANVILNLSFLPHYILYARSLDRLLVIATVIPATLNIIFNYILIKNLGIYGAAYSKILAYATMLILKFYFLKKGNNEFILGTVA